MRRRGDRDRDPRVLVGERDREAPASRLVVVLGVVAEQVIARIRDLARRAKDMRVIPVPKDLAPALERPIERLRHTNRQPLHSARKRPRIRSLDEKVNVIALNRITHHAKPKPLPPFRKRLLERGKTNPRAQVPHVLAHLHGHMHRKPRRKRRPRAVRYPRPRPTRPPPPPPNRLHRQETELPANHGKCLTGTNCRSQPPFTSSQEKKPGGPSAQPACRPAPRQQRRAANNQRHRIKPRPAANHRPSRQEHPVRKKKQSRRENHRRSAAATPPRAPPTERRVPRGKRDVLAKPPPASRSPTAAFRCASSTTRVPGGGSDALRAIFGDKSHRR